MMTRIQFSEAEHRLGMTEAERQEIMEFCRDRGAPHHAATMIDYINSRGPVKARAMLDSCSMWAMAAFAGVRFPAGW